MSVFEYPMTANKSPPKKKILRRYYDSSVNVAEFNCLKCHKRFKTHREKTIHVVVNHTRIPKKKRK